MSKAEPLLNDTELNADTSFGSLQNRFTIFLKRF